MVTANNNNVLIEQLKEHFELQSDPFASLTNVFYEGAQRKHAIETLRHLATFGDMVLLLTGDKGAGKTTLIRQFIRLDIEELNVFYVDAEHDLSEGDGHTSAVSFLAGQAELPLINSESIEQILQRLSQKLELEFQEGGSRTLLIVDNAERLPRKELQTYFSFFKDLPAESGIVILFSGLGSLTQYAKLGTNIGQEEWVHQIQMKSLYRAEQIEYLQLRLEAVGYTGRLKLTDNQLKHLTDVSKGLPGRINRIFSSVVLEPGLLKIEQPKRVGAPKAITFGVIGLLFLSFLLVSFQHNLFVFSETDSNDLVEGLSAGEGSNEEVPTDTADEIDYQALERARRIKALDLALEKNRAEIKETVIVADEPVVIVLENKGVSPGISVEIADEEAIKPIQVAAIDTDIVTAKTSVDVSNESSLLENREAVGTSEMKVDKPYFKTKKWIQFQTQSRYSAQILGSYSEETAIKYIKKLGDVGQVLFYLKTLHKNREWYVVFYGNYATKKDAQKAISTSPDSIKSQRPWLRSLGGILKSYPKN